MPGLRIALIGAESTGKTALAQQLAEHLASATGLRCQAVPEVLRHWCDAHGRTPHPDEQLGIAQAQAQAIDAAAQTHDVVLADTTPLMTAVYSELLFADKSLHPFALAYQAQCDLTLLTALDIPWVADGLQRDGPHVRVPVDSAIRAALIGTALPFSVVHGTGPARLASALDRITPLLLTRPAPRNGLFTRLAEREAAQPAWQWVCENCDEPGCEHLVFGLRGQR